MQKISGIKVKFEENRKKEKSLEEEWEKQERMRKVLKRIGKVGKS